jgi:WD40 repeat protein
LLRASEVPQGRHVEILRQEGGHEAEIVAISFCDELRAYATSALDCTIRFWDFEKRIIRSILFNTPRRCLLFTALVGDILLTQGRHISTIARDVWEERGLLHLAKESEDPWEKISS